MADGARRVLRLLEEKGHRIVRDPDRGAVIDPPLDEEEWLKLVHEAKDLKLYRAAIYAPRHSHPIALTGPEDSSLDTNAMMERAVETARRIGIVPRQISEAKLRSALQIWWWDDGAR